MMYLNFFVPIFVLFFKNNAVEAQRLSYNFYNQTCPHVEQIVQDRIKSVTFLDPTRPASLLRLMFHDCQVQGCDASILLDGDGSEMSSSKNFAIRNRQTINDIKSEVEEICPGKVSCADILIMAARDAVELSGGPRIRVPFGRRDSSNHPNFKLADTSLPSSDIGVDSMLRLFAKKGMTVEESVAILGAHTLGVIHCVNLQNRLGNLGSGNSMNLGFESLLRMKCLSGSLMDSQMNFVLNDLTATMFDNQYFVDSLHGRGVLRIDADMALDSRTGPVVNKFANDQDAFFRAFSSSFVKLSYSEVLIGDQGLIRRNCNSLN